MNPIHEIMRKLSTSNEEKNEFDIIGNCFGFFNLQSGLGTSTLITEIANKASEEGVHVCIVDCNPVSTFFLTKCTKKLSEDDIKDVPSIANRLKKRSSDLTNSLIQYSPTLHILSFGDMQYSETFDLDASIIQDTFQELKQTFDLVLMDIPNMPWVETVILALKTCSTVYCMCDFSADTIYRHIKCSNFYELAGLTNILNSIVICKTPKGTSLSRIIQQNIKANVLAEVPYVPGISKASLNDFSILSHIQGKEAKMYAKSINFFLSEIFNGISEKVKHNEEKESKSKSKDKGKSLKDKEEIKFIEGRS